MTAGFRTSWMRPRTYTENRFQPRDRITSVPGYFGNAFKGVVLQQHSPFMFIIQLDGSGQAQACPESILIFEDDFLN